MTFRDRVIELRRIRACDLKPNGRNWRTHPEKQRRAFRAILGEVGFAGAELAYASERNGGALTLIDWHMRQDEAGEAEIPCVVTDLTDAEADKMLAVFDPIAAMAGADKDKLDGLLHEIQTGSEDLAAMLQALAKDAGCEWSRNGEVIEDEVPEPPVNPITKPGDLWLLGEHRLLCGDSTKAEDVARLMGEETAVLMNTDAPYGIDYAALKNGIPRSGFKDIQARGGDIANDDLTCGPELQEFLERMIKAAIPHMVANPAFYFWHPMLTQGTFFAAAAADILIHRQIVWIKPHMVLTRSGMYHWQHELCFYGWIRGKPCLWRADKSQTSVWKCGEGQQDRVHPTQKPVELFARPINNHTREREVCYEPFSGSGSQLIAAEQLSRRCFAMELEPRYVDVAVQRWEKLTGKSAVLEAT